jgi:hypothetical protein
MCHPVDGLKKRIQHRPQRPEACGGGRALPGPAACGGMGIQPAQQVAQQTDQVINSESGVPISTECRPYSCWTKIAGFCSTAAFNSGWDICLGAASGSTLAEPSGGRNSKWWTPLLPSELWSRARPLQEDACADQRPAATALKDPICRNTGTFTNAATYDMVAVILIQRSFCILSRAKCVRLQLVRVATWPMRCKREVLTTGSAERAQAIGRARNIGQRTAKYPAYHARAEI